jgi:hypothetical protein
MSAFDIRDWFVMGLVTLAWIASTIFLFIHPDATNFATWAGLSATMCGTYHWLVYADSKKPDANEDQEDQEKSGSSAQ